MKLNIHGCFNTTSKLLIEAGYAVEPCVCKTVEKLIADKQTLENILKGRVNQT